MNRLIKTMEDISNNSYKFLVAYLTGGVPDIEGTIDYIRAIEKGGADIIEIGIPFSDALADGPVNQEAALMAIKKGIGIGEIFKMVKKIRRFSDIPLVFLVYYNTIFHYGIQKFTEDCRKQGVDGLVIPDLPMEERGEIMEFVRESGISLIPLVAPNSKNRVKSVISDGSGFVYCVSSMGVTGERKNFHDDIKMYIEEVKQSSSMPLAVGFGISDSETAEFFYNIADGVIVGSAIVKRILNGCVPEDLEIFIRSLKKKK